MSVNDENDPHDGTKYKSKVGLVSKGSGLKLTNADGFVYNNEFTAIP
jgi:hypothetical protein